MRGACRGSVNSDARPGCNHQITPLPGGSKRLARPATALLMRRCTHRHLARRGVACRCRAQRAATPLAGGLEFVGQLHPPCRRLRMGGETNGRRAPRLRSFLERPHEWARAPALPHAVTPPPAGHPSPAPDVQSRNAMSACLPPWPSSLRWSARRRPPRAQSRPWRARRRPA